MNSSGWLQLGLYVAILTLITKPMGLYLMQVLDAKTGKKLWDHDFQESTWCSPYYVDGRVFLGTERTGIGVVI